MPRMLSMIMVVGLMILGAMLRDVSLPDPPGTSVNVLAQRPDCSADQRLGSAARHREASLRIGEVLTGRGLSQDMQDGSFHVNHSLRAHVRSVPLLGMKDHPCTLVSQRSQPL